MKLAVVGSKTISRTQAEAAWVLIQGLIALWRPREVISGGATGVDSVAEEVARRLGYDPDNPYTRLVVYRPEVHQWEGVGGYKHRNLKIVERCDHLVRIARRTGGTYGSGWTADEAERHGKTVYRFWV